MSAYVLHRPRPTTPLTGSGSPDEAGQPAPADRDHVLTSRDLGFELVDPGLQPHHFFLQPPDFVMRSGQRIDGLHRSTVSGAGAGAKQARSPRSRRFNTEQVSHE